MLIRIKNIIAVVWVLSIGMAWGQAGTSIADEYYKAGEFEKAANEYINLLKTEVTWTRLVRYVTSLGKK